MPFTSAARKFFGRRDMPRNRAADQKDFCHPPNFLRPLPVFFAPIDMEDASLHKWPCHPCCHLPPATAARWGNPSGSIPLPVLSRKKKPSGPPCAARGPTRGGLASGFFYAPACGVVLPSPFYRSGDFARPTSGTRGSGIICGLGIGTIEWMQHGRTFRPRRGACRLRRLRAPDSAPVESNERGDGDDHRRREHQRPPTHSCRGLRPAAAPRKIPAKG